MTTESETMKKPSTKLAYFKGSDLVVGDPTYCTLAHYVMEKCEQNASDDKIAYVDTTSNREVTFGEFRNKVRRLAHGLKEAGYEPGQVACIHCYNIPEFIIALQAAMAIGMSVTLCNSLYSSYEVAHQLKDSSSVLIFTGADKELVDKCVKAAFDNKEINSESATKIKEIVLLSDEKVTIDSEMHGIKQSHYLDHLAQDTEQFNQSYPDVKIDWNSARALIPYSSGTTGLSKGVALTHYSVYYNMHQIISLLGISSDDSFFSVPPLYHIYGALTPGTFTLLNGMTAVLQQRFDFVAMLKAIEKYKITRVALVPPIMLAIAKHPIVDKYNLTSVTGIICGAAPMPAEQIEIALKRINPDGEVMLTQAYGMTETGGGSTATPLDAPRQYIEAGTVGVTLPGSEIKIIDVDSGETVTCGVQGEVCMRAKSMMQCYLNREKETAKTVQSDGWLRSGDLGHLNEDGYLWITDRLKELIKYKGFQVPPAQLEALLLTFEPVQDCAVIGIPDEAAGELPRAYVQLKHDFVGKVTEEEVAVFVKERVAPFKQLKGGVVFVETIPKSAAGKLLRRVLKDSYVNSLK